MDRKLDTSLVKKKARYIVFLIIYMRLEGVFLSAYDLSESRSSPVWIPLEGVNFASRPLIHFLIKNLSCYSKKHAARIKLEGIYTAEEPISNYGHGYQEPTHNIIVFDHFLQLVTMVSVHIRILRLLAWNKVHFGMFTHEWM
jgi:hypothetical protein